MCIETISPQNQSTSGAKGVWTKLGLQSHLTTTYLINSWRALKPRFQNPVGGECLFGIHRMAFYIIPHDSAGATSRSRPGGRSYKIFRDIPQMTHYILEMA